MEIEDQIKKSCESLLNDIINDYSLRVTCDYFLQNNWLVTLRINSDIINYCRQIIVTKSYLETVGYDFFEEVKTSLEKAKSNNIHE